jgi:valyl-tRNA synthetase
MIKEAAIAFEMIAQIRNTRNAKGLSPKDALTLQIKSPSKEDITSFHSVIQKLANLRSIDLVKEFGSNGSSFIVKSIELFIPLEGKINKSKETEKLLSELEYVRGFLAAVDKKLQNERFVSGAPVSVIEAERRKKADAEAKIRVLEQNLAAMGSS